MLALVQKWTRNLSARLLKDAKKALHLNMISFTKAAFSLFLVVTFSQRKRKADPQHFSIGSNSDLVQCKSSLSVFLGLCRVTHRLCLQYECLNKQAPQNISLKCSIQTHKFLITRQQSYKYIYLYI